MRMEITTTLRNNENLPKLGANRLVRLKCMCIAITAPGNYDNVFADVMVIEPTLCENRPKHKCFEGVTTQIEALTVLHFGSTITLTITQ